MMWREFKVCCNFSLVVRPTQTACNTHARRRTGSRKLKKRGPGDLLLFPEYLSPEICKTLQDIFYWAFFKNKTQFQRKRWAAPWVPLLTSPCHITIIFKIAQSMERYNCSSEVLFQHKAMFKNILIKRANEKKRWPSKYVQIIKLLKPMKCGVINAFDGITVKKPSKWKQNKNKARYVIVAATKNY